MTGVQHPGETGDGGQARAWSMLSDGELAEVISEAVTSDEVARAEAALLGAQSIRVTDAERIAQLDTDRQLVALLASTGFEGDRFKAALRKLNGRLIGYAFPILRAWMYEGTIFGECLKYRGRIDAPAAEAAARWSDDDRTEVIHETLLSACEFFLDYALRQGKWDYRRGAALTTYFVGACVCCFIKVCNNRWKRQQLQDAFIYSAPHIEDDGGWDEHRLELVNSIPSSEMGPAELVAVRDHAAQVFAKIDNAAVREVLVHRMNGATQIEAAHEVGLTPKAAERRLHTQRRKLRPPTMPGTTEDEGRA